MADAASNVWQALGGGGGRKASRGQRARIKKAAVADAAEAGEDALYDAPGFYKIMGDSWFGGGDGGGGRRPVQDEQAVGSGGAPILVWFRQDLRLRDNPALHAASRQGVPVIPVFIWCPSEEGKWPLGGAQRYWLHQALSRLDNSLKERYGKGITPPVVPCST